MKYHLGCGSQYLEGYLNVDFPSDQHNVNFNIRADLYTDILTMKYDECDEIKSHHFFEHFNYFETFILLFKWTNALKIGGKLIIDIPDLEALCRAYFSTNIATKFLVARYLFGSHEADWAYHINGWSQDTLEYVLCAIGFRLERVVKYGDPGSAQPNCGITFEAILSDKPEINKLQEILASIFALYKNGDTIFENSLCDYFIEEFEKGIVI